VYRTTTAVKAVIMKEAAIHVLELVANKKDLPNGVTVDPSFTPVSTCTYIHRHTTYVNMLYML
jgi:hypothetical protein